MGLGAHQVDVGIITILESEFEAVHCRLPKPEIVSCRREYNVSALTTRAGDPCTVALTRCLEPGTGEAQTVARDLIEDLDPQWLLVVGIAGGIPDGELTLGDVIISTRIHDFTVEAVTADHDREYDAMGGPIHPAAGKIIANLRARLDELGAWGERAVLGDRPPVEIRDDALRGDDAWRTRVRDSLHRHFGDGRTRDPIFVAAPIASSDRLVKDTDVAASWLRHARKIRAIEMEAAGVYRAAVAREIPAVAIRGISDVVGFARDDAWARYACHSAAAFALAFLRLGALPSRARRGRRAPPQTRYADAATEKLCQDIAETRERRDRLRARGEATTEVDRKIRQLRQDLREGGRLCAGDALADGRYLLVEQIGRGGFASVWRAFDTARGDDVAIKVLHANLAGDLQRRERFFRGARIMAELDHPSVVRVLSREGHDLGFYFFVMEYVAGGNLLDAVLHHRISRAQVLSVIYAVGDVLGRGHTSGFIHRDVKPENILLAPDLTARLTDFDLVGAADTTGGTRTGVLGTYIYAAPEQFEHPQDADARADVHGLGMTLVFALFGRQLPHRATLDRHRFVDSLDCSPEMKAVLKRAIEIEPADRTPDVAAFCLALSELPEVRKLMATELCTEDIRQLAPVVRFHDRLAMPPDVATTMALLRHHHAGRIAQASGDLADAAVQYGKALDVRADHVPTLTAQAQALAEAERWAEHVDALCRIPDMARDPRDQVAALVAAAAACETQLRDLARARSLYEAALVLEPDHATATERRAAIVADLERWTLEAAELIERARRTALSYRKTPILREAAAIFEDKLRSPRQALEVLTTALRWDPRDAATAVAVERIALAAGRWTETIDEIAAGDHRVGALESLSAACAERGAWDRAAELLLRAEVDAPAFDRIRLLNKAGHIHLDHLRNHDRAQALFAEVLRLDPEHVGSGRPLADLYFAAERWTELSPVIEMLCRKLGHWGVITDLEPPETDPRKLCELHYRAARTATQLGDSRKALHHYKAAYDLDSTHIPMQIGRADLLFDRADFTAAERIYATLLAQHRDSLSHAEVARIYRQLGAAQLALGDAHEALAMLERALETEPTDRQALETMIELQHHQGDWVAVISAMRGLMATGSARENAQQLDEIAAIYQDKLHDPMRAVAAYREALAIEPDDHQRLQRLLATYTETSQWGGAIEVIERFIAIEPDPVRRGTYHHAAAVVYRDEIRSLGDAAQRFDQALDEFFAEPAQLTDAMVPRALSSFDALTATLTVMRDWKALERAYRRMIERLRDASGPVFHHVMVGLLDGLAEVERSRLQQPASAAQALAVAQQLDPHNRLRADGRDRAELLAEIYRGAGPEHLAKAIEQHMRMLRDDPFKIESYRALRQLYFDAHHHDKTWCVCSALAFLKKAQPDERQFFEQYRPRGLVKAQAAVTPEVWTRLVHPEENRAISAILATCWHAVSVMKAYPHKELGLRRKDRRQLHDDSLTFSGQLRYAAGILGIALPEVYVVTDDKPAEIQLANAIDRNELCPSFVVRPHLLQGKTERELAFLSARRLTLLRPEYYLKLLLPTHTELTVVVLSAVAMVQPRFPVPPDMVPLVQHYLPELQKRMPAQIVAQLRADVMRFVDAAPDLNLARWAHAVDATSYRVGLALCDDLETAARMVTAEPVGLVGPQLKDKIKQLVLYSISEDYFAVREHLGITIRQAAERDLQVS